MPYNDALDSKAQVDAEEWIAGVIAEHQEMVIAEQTDGEYGPDMLFSEEDCAALGRRLLHGVLERFRPDLVELVDAPEYLPGEDDRDLFREVTPEDVVDLEDELRDRDEGGAWESLD